MSLNSEIILCSGIKMDRQYTNVLSYSESQMLSLCRQKAVASSNKYSFLRPTNSLYVDFTYEQCLQANYIAFQNKDYSNKWFFAWIDEVIFKGEKNCEIKYTVDSWSTWFSYWTKKPCFVNRHHVNDDVVGLHTIPENLDIGQLISDNTYLVNELGSESYFYIVIASNYNPAGTGTQTAGIGIYADYPQGSMWFAWLVNRNNFASTINEISQWIYDITVQQHANDIQSMFALPYQAFNLIGDIDETTHEVINGKGRKLNEELTFSKSLYREFTDFIPKNNKLYTYPYSFLRITNNLGSYNDYKIEDFNEYVDNVLTDDLKFNVIGVPCIGYSGKIRPKNYQGIEYNEDESLQLGKYPTLSWSVDAFTNWLTQNSVNISIGAISNIIGSTISIVTGMSTGNALGVASGIISVANSVANTFGQFTQASMLPNTAQGNANAGDLSFIFNINRFKILHMRPKKEYLQRCDDFFSRFGYKINRVIEPNITGRTYWNYVEIGSTECIGYGTVPANFMETINNACRKGVTIWHNHDNIGNYNLDNTIV